MFTELKFIKISLLLFILFGNQLFCQVSFESKFELFWNNSLIELNSIPLEYESVFQKTSEGKKIELIKIRFLDNIYLYIRQSQPIKEGMYPTKIRFSGFGKGNTSRDKISNDAFMKTENTICIKVDVRGQGLSTEQIEFKGYLNNGIQTKETYVYRGAFMDAVRVVDYAEQNDNSNG